MIRVHDTRCPQSAGLVTQAARSVDPMAEPHYCLPSGFAPAVVAVETVTVPGHEYRPGMIWPAGAPRELCAVCRETHL